jgi:hypothetical protein
MEIEAPVSRPLHVSDSDTIRSRRRQVGGKSPEPAAPERTAATKKPAPIAQAPVETRADRRERKEIAAAKASPPPEAPEKVAPVKREAPVAPVPIERETESPKPKVPAKPAAASGRRSRGGKDSVSIAARLGDSSPKDDAETVEPLREVPATETVSAQVEPEAVVDTSLAARRKKITADARPKGPDDLGRVRVPEPVSRTAAREGRTEASATLVEPTRVDIEADSDDVRFAQEGHHPSETSTGLLAKLRRQPKLPDDHIHKFKESGSSVGLVRRVCIECAYVSIGSDDD